MYLVEARAQPTIPRQPHEVVDVAVAVAVAGVITVGYGDSPAPTYSSFECSRTRPGSTTHSLPPGSDVTRAAIRA